VTGGAPATTTLPQARAGVRLRGTAALQILTLAALLVAVYHRTFAELWHVWTHNDNYSHGPLVPLVAVALAWLRRDRLAEATIRPDARGLALVALACALQVLGIRADVFTFEGWSIPVMVTGLSLTFFGVEVTRALAFPIGYLVFMLTFPPFIVTTLSQALKEITVRLAIHAAEALGVLVRRSGMTLYLTGGELRVENPCSGLRSLIALLATGAVFAWLQPGGGWRRPLVLLTAIPIAVIGNAIRLTAMLLVAHYDGVDKVAGFFHDASGWAVYVLALGGLFGVRRLLTPRPRVATG